MHRPIYVVEGPAGCGKSTLIKRLSHLWTPVDKVVEFPRPRAFVGDEGTAYSLIKDCISVVSTSLMEPDAIPVLDRWNLSQIVYGSIRRDEKGINELHLMNQLLLGHQSFEHMALEMASRKGTAFLPDFQFKITYLVLLPTVGIITNNRQKTEREFPYDAQEELNRYHAVASLAEQTGIDRVIGFSIGHYDGYEEAAAIIEGDLIKARRSYASLTN